MSSRSLNNIGLQPAQVRAFEKKARHEGLTAIQYVRQLIERDLKADESFDQILAPIREDFRKARVTENQLDAMVKRARHVSSRREGRSQTRRMR